MWIKRVATWFWVWKLVIVTKLRKVIVSPIIPKDVREGERVPKAVPLVTLECAGHDQHKKEVELSLLDDFRAISLECSAQVKYEQREYFSTAAPYVAYVTAVASTIPLAVLIKAIRDILIKWIETTKRPIKINIDGKREIEVNTVAQLEALIKILENSTFFQRTPDK